MFKKLIIFMIILFPVVASAQPKPSIFEEGAKGFTGIMIPINPNTNGIKSARLRNGIVRVKKSAFELKYLGGTQTNYPITESGRLSLGPYVAGVFDPDSEYLLNGLSAGVTLTFKTDNDKENDNGVTFFIGGILERIKVLGGGIKANEPLPPSEDLWYGEENELSWGGGFAWTF